MNCRSQQKLYHDVEYICDGLMDLSGIKSHVPLFLTKLLKVQEDNYKLKYERGEGEGKAGALGQLHSEAIRVFKIIKSHSI